MSKELVKFEQSAKSLRVALSSADLAYMMGDRFVTAFKFRKIEFPESAHRYSFIALWHFRFHHFSWTPDCSRDDCYAYSGLEHIENETLQIGYSPPVSSILFSSYFPAFE
jgi:hypothetical protein